jgi:hypothetical protein
MQEPNNGKKWKDWGRTTISFPIIVFPFDRRCIVRWSHSIIDRAYHGNRIFLFPRLLNMHLYANCSHVCAILFLIAKLESVSRRRYLFLQRVLVLLAHLCGLMDLISRASWLIEQFLFVLHCYINNCWRSSMPSHWGLIQWKKKKHRYLSATIRRSLILYLLLYCVKKWQVAFDNLGWFWWGRSGLRGPMDSLSDEAHNGEKGNDGLLIVGHARYIDQ